jgi:hypothetical protein
MFLVICFFRKCKIGLPPVNINKDRLEFEGGGGHSSHLLSFLFNDKLIRLGWGGGLTTFLVVMAPSPPILQNGTYGDIIALSICESASQLHVTQTVQVIHLEQWVGNKQFY